jgi:translation initiation factor IF-2
MPVRIYDIAKKLGIESKEVIAKAKELGITTAKVPSSSLDKITAEFLLESLGHRAQAAPAPPPPAPVEPVRFVSAPPPPAEPGPAAPPSLVTAEPETTTATAPAEPEMQVPEAEPAEIVALPVETGADAAAPGAPEAPEPAVPRVPQLGEKVGFIQLPQRPAARQPERPGHVAPAQRAATPPRPGLRPGVRPGAQPAVARGPGRPMAEPQKGGPRGPAQTPSEPEFVPPTTGELITLKPPIIVRELAERLNRKPFQLIADLIQLNVFANVNQALDEGVAQRICAKYGFRFEVEKRERGAGIVHAPVRKVELDVDDKPEDLQLRAPVVTIMGHVDHGKTTLLDVIRKTNVAAGEAGGITQHIGAYTITIPHPERPSDLQQITFLDTPGHAAFSAMRARGANVTDIVILVVASNDGVMPQTVEALNHARAAKVPMIVAVNKCDHPNANPLRVRQQLQETGVVCEEWGGETIFVDISALTKHGIDKLLELIVLQAEVMELKANPNRAARGNVIESGLEPGGPTATVLVRKGTLRVGEVVLCGAFYGKVRALINEEGKRSKEAGPSVAVKVLGLNGVPEAGLEFSVVEDERTGRELAEQRREAASAQAKDRRPKITLENLFDALAADAAKVLKVVVKADTQGSVEAIVDALKGIDSDKVSLEVMHSAVGTVTESDVLLASASHAIVVGFHTRIDNGVPEVAKREGVQIKQYTIIYELIDQLKEAMAGLLEPVVKEVVLGAAEVRQVFSLSKGGNVAGCMVTSGRITKGKVRVLRRREAIHEGVVQTLRRFQDEVTDVRAGMECGIRVSSFDAFQPGDVIESFTTEKVAQKL